MKLTRSIVAVAALTSMSFAGGLINEPVYENEIVEVPVEPVVVEAPKPEPKPEPKPVVVVPPVVEASKFYVAGGLTDVAVSTLNRASLFKSKNGQDRQVAITGRLGYDFMNYLGAELRGTYGIAKDNGSKFKQVGAYLKPNYDIADTGLNVYGLLGASKTNAGVGSETGFSYGAGLDYAIPSNDKISVFTDVVNYMKKSGTASQWGLTLGAAYKF